MLWNDIVGHQENISFLQNIIVRGQIPHAFLFVGPEGIGKVTVARIIARAILCLSPLKPCNKCEACLAMARKAHPDFLEIVPDGVNIKIDQIRSLQRYVSMTPHIGSYRVCIIDNAEAMTDQAANSLLKILEEPPPSLIFILVSAQKDKLLDTILSRCSILPFYSLNYDVLTNALVDRGYGTSAAAAARLSGGCMGTALKLLEPGGLDLRVQAIEIIDALPGDMDFVWKTMENLGKLETVDILSLYKFMIYILRDLLILKKNANEKLLINQDIINILKKISHAWSFSSLTKAYEAVKDSERALLLKANTRLNCEALLINICDISSGR